MMSNNVIDFQSEKRRRELVAEECLDVNDVVLDLSDVVLTVNDLDYDVTVTDDSIIISMGDAEES